MTETAFLQYTGYVLAFFAVWIVARCARSMLSERYVPEVWGYLELPDGTSRTIEHWECILGRAKASDIVLTGEGIERIHAAIQRSGAVLMDAETAEYAGECMSYDVAYGYGRDRFPGLDLCAKSGTAEVGDGTTHAWFVGYLRTGAPVAFAVMLEHGGGGLLQAGGVANSVLQTVMEYYSDD